MERIAHYPPALMAQMASFLAEPRKTHVAVLRGVPGGNKLNQIPSKAKLTKEEIQREGWGWACAMLAPCLFVAAVTSDAAGEIVNVESGHFSTRFSKPEIGRFLAAAGPAEKTKILMAGLAQKASRETLETTVGALMEAIADFGIPLDLQWEAEDRPLLIDRRDGREVSDFGLGILPVSGEPTGERRLVSVGAMSYQAVLVSTVFLWGEKGMLPVETTFITTDVGRIRFSHT